MRRYVRLLCPMVPYNNLCPSTVGSGAMVPFWRRDRHSIVSCWVTVLVTRSPSAGSRGLCLSFDSRLLYCMCGRLLSRVYQWEQSGLHSGRDQCFNRRRGSPSHSWNEMGARLGILLSDRALAPEGQFTPAVLAPE